MVRFNPRFRQAATSYFDYVMIVEGAKDMKALENVGFSRIYILHMNGVTLKERVEQIAAELDKKVDKVCILTDLDAKGKKLYMAAKDLFQEYGVKLDSSFRGLLLKARLEHVNQVGAFFGKIEKI